MSRMLVITALLGTLLAASWATAAPVKQQPIPPETVLGQHLAGVVGELREGRQPQGRYLVFVQVEDTQPTADGEWSSTVSLFDAQYKPPRADVAAAIGKALVAGAAGVAATGAATDVAVRTGSSTRQAAELGATIASAGATPNEDMLPATIYLDDSGLDSEISGYLPAGSLVAVWVEYGPDGTASPVVDSSLGGLHGPHPTVVYRKMDVQDVYPVMQRLQMPNSTDETLKQYETARRKLQSGDAATLPTELDEAVSLLSGDAAATREIHERYLRQQLTRGTHASTDHVALARLLQEDGRHEEALAEFDDAITLDGERPDLDLERATCLYMLQRDEEAWTLLEGPLAEDATLAVHLCNQIAARSGYDISHCTADELDELPW